jgi:hypothetical protein
MLTAEDVLGQVLLITRSMVELGLCDDQAFPVLHKKRNGIKEITVPNSVDLSVSLKNIEYAEIYETLADNKSYNFKMVDGALVQIFYTFINNKIKSHRLAFFPSPNLAEFQSNPEIYELDEVYADVIMKNIVPFPIRFDFDCDDNSHIAVWHPKAHLTLGQYLNCRIPVSAPVTPSVFVGFLLRSFYNTAYQRYSDKITIPDVAFEATIVLEEERIPHLLLCKPV